MRNELPGNDIKLLYDLMPGNTSDIAWIYDLGSSTFTYVSPSVSISRGYEPDEATRQPVSEKLTDECFNQIETIFRARIKAYENGDESQRVSHSRVELVHRNGAIIPAEIATTLVRDQQGAVSHIMGITRPLGDNRFEKAFSSSLIPSTITRLKDGLIMEANPSIERIFGYTPGEILGKTGTEMKIIERRTRAEFLENLMSSGSLIDFPLRLLRKGDENARNVLVSARLMDINGEDCIVTNFIDITERKIVEEKLKEDEVKYRYLFEHNPAPMLIYDTESLMLLSVNEVFTINYGYSAAEATRMKLTDLYPPTERQLIVELAHKLKGYANVGEWHHIKKDGSRITIVAQSHDLVLNGRKSRIATITDISNWKSTEEERSLFLTTLNHSINEIYIFNADTFTFEFVSSGALHNLGYTMDELKHMTPLDIKPYLTPDKFNGFIQTLRQKLLPVALFETVHQRKNGTQYPVEVHLQMVDHPQRSIFLAVVIDISERKETEMMLKKQNENLARATAQAMESDKLKTQFLNNISHEVRTPMNAIMGFSELLPSNFNNKEKLTLYSNIISQRCNDLLDIINDIIVVSRLESGEMRVQNEDFDLAKLLAEIYSHFKAHQQKQNNQHVAFEIVPMQQVTPNFIYSDRGKLRQILMSLIHNAFKFTNSGSITVEYEMKDQRSITFSVIDTGIGMESRHIPQIFERFSKLDTSNTQYYSGTGLGLTIVRGILQLLGGDIKVSSTPNIGSSFTFTVPCEISATPASLQVEMRKTKPAENSKTRLLVVEDDYFNTQYLNEILQERDFDLSFVDSGEAAVELAMSGSKFDIILMDIRLPGIDGFEATRIISNIDPAARIIAQTAYATSLDRTKALEAGCCDYIAKPVKQQTLLRLIDNALQSPVYL